MQHNQVTPTQYPPPPQGMQEPPPPDPAYPPQQAPYQPPPAYGAQGYPLQGPVAGVQPTHSTLIVTQPGLPNYGKNTCPYCGGLVKEKATLLGILLVFLFFPLGIICCLLMVERRCTLCKR